MPHTRCRTSRPARLLSRTHLPLVSAEEAQHTQRVPAAHTCHGAKSESVCWQHTQRLHVVSRGVPHECACPGITQQPTPRTLFFTRAMCTRAACFCFASSPRKQARHATNDTCSRSVGTTGLGPGVHVCCCQVRGCHAALVHARVKAVREDRSPPMCVGSHRASLMSSAQLEPRAGNSTITRHARGTRDRRGDHHKTRAHSGQQARAVLPAGASYGSVCCLSAQASAQ
jgi:hypothetical protein